MGHTIGNITPEDQSMWETIELVYYKCLLLRIKIWVLVRLVRTTPKCQAIYSYLLGLFFLHACKAEI